MPTRKSKGINNIREKELLTLIFLIIMFSSPTLAEVITNPSDLNIEDYGTQVYAPFYEESYKIDKSLLDYFDKELNNMYRQQELSKKYDKYILIYIENSKAETIDDFVDWSDEVALRTEIDDKIYSVLSKNRKSCITLVSYSSPLSYILLSSTGSCQNLPQSVLKEYQPYFGSLSTPEEKEEVKKWFRYLFSKALGMEKYFTDEVKGRDQLFSNKIKAEKKPLAYEKKEVFIISDRNWQDVLSLLPATTWDDFNKVDQSWCKKGYDTAQDICIYPTLIFHQEDKAIDADAIIEFLKEYKPTKITYIKSDKDSEISYVLSYLSRELKKMQANKENIVQTMKPEDFTKFWKEYNTVVLCEDEYDLGLVASVYASHINSPLIIENSVLDKPENFYDKQVLCIGEVEDSERCDIIMNKQQSYESYCKDAYCSRQIYVNPLDLKIFHDFTLYPSYTSEGIRKLFTKNSLCAPFLAAAKKEILVSDTPTPPSISYTIPEINKKIKEYFTSYATLPEYEEASCELGESCSEGYMTLYHEGYLTDGTFEINIPNDVLSELSSATDISLNLNAVAYKCSTDRIEKMSLLIDSKEVWKGDVRCTSNIFMSDLSEQDIPRMINIPISKDEITSNKFKFELKRNLFFEVNTKEKNTVFYSITYLKDGELKSYECKLENIEDCFSPSPQEQKTTMAKRGISLKAIAKDEGNKDIRFSIPVKENQGAYLKFNFRKIAGLDSLEKVKLNIKINGKTFFEEKRIEKIESQTIKIEPESEEINIVIEGPSSFINMEDKITNNMLFTVSVEALKVEEFSRDKIDKYPYITLFGPGSSIPEETTSPNAQRSILTLVKLGKLATDSADSAIYGDFVKEMLPDVAVGRIKGFSTSDVSSLISRTLFYDDLAPPKPRAVLMATADPEGPETYMENRVIAEKFGEILSKSEIDFESYIKDSRTFKFPSRYWKDKQLILYYDHGNHDWAGIDSHELPTLNNPVVSLMACLPCSTDTPDSFCNNLIRKGAINTIVASDIAFVGQYLPFSTIYDMLDKGWSMGQSFQRNYVYGNYNKMYQLLGDPTFRFPKEIEMTNGDELIAFKIIPKDLN